jgi:hypothetical protein
MEIKWKGCFEKKLFRPKTIKHQVQTRPLPFFPGKAVRFLGCICFLGAERLHEI